MFGTGIVDHVGRCKEQSAVWVNFYYGERKALSLDYESRSEASRAVESRTPLGRSFDATSTYRARLC